MDNTKYKNTSAYFYRMEVGKSTDRDKFRNNILELWNSFEKRDYTKSPQLILDGDEIYVSAMEKVPLGLILLPDGQALDTFALMLNFQRVNSSEPVSFGDLTMPVNDRQKTLSSELENMKKDSKDAESLVKRIKDGNIGPLVNSPILYDPFRRILLRVRQAGDMTNNQVLRYLKKAFDFPGGYLQIILDGQAISDIDNFDMLLELSYAVASPDNFKNFANNNQSEFKDLAYASQLNSRNIRIVMTGPDLTIREAKKKVVKLLSEQEGMETKKVSIKGIADGSDKEIDFIKNRLKYDGGISYDPEKGVTIKDNFNFLAYAYRQKLSFLKDRFNVEWD